MITDNNINIILDEFLYFYYKYLQFIGNFEKYNINALIKTK